MIDTKLIGTTMTLTLDGVVEAQDVRATHEALETAFLGQSNLNLVVDMSDWTDMTEDAIHEDMALELKLLGKLGRIDRIALISDKNWIGAVANLFEPWLPGTEMCRFTTAARDEAQTWAMHKKDAA
ncbi:MAG TPA: hypothetical protein DEO85_00565 [Maritimibacter sp.]|nr:hypothetical protein [Maritimibacter sp.]